MASFSVIKSKGAKPPAAPFSAIKEAILGKGYELNLIFCGSAEMRRLNLIYRDKDEPTDILSFPLSDGSGDIYICLSEARKQAGSFGLSFDDFVPFLFIHGCVHLKGYDHGARMERIEAGFRERFGITTTNNING